MLCFNFGPHKRKDVRDHIDYLQWMEGKDFAPDTLRIVESTLDRLYRELSGQDFDDDDLTLF